MSVSAESIVRAIGLILSNTAVYGAAHAVTRQSAETCYQLLGQAFGEGDVSVNVSEAGLQVNHMTVESKNMLVQHFADHLESREITNFSLKPGMTQDQFLAFVEVLAAKPEELELLGGFPGAIAAVGLGEAVAARKVVYREISEEEEVVDRQRLEELSQATEDGAHGGGDHDAVQAVMAFLRGDVEVSEEDAARSVRDMGADADQLAELIMHSAEVRASATSIEGGETLGDLVVGCLRRAYQAMTEDPSFHTQKTKKQVQRTLALLERDLLEKLQAMGDAADPGSLDAVKEAVEEMTDELTLDALAQEYAKKRSAVGTTEKRLMRYLKRKGADGLDESELRQRLAEGGLDDDGWHELLVKSGMTIPEPEPAADAAGGPGGGGLGLFGGDGGLGGLGALASLLEKIEADVGGGSQTQADVDGGPSSATGAQGAGDETAGGGEGDGGATGQAIGAGAGAGLETETDPGAGAGDGPGPSPGGDAATVAGSGRTVVLRVPEAVFKEDLHAVQAEINQIIRRTEASIETLIEEVRGKRDGKEKDAARPRLTRKRLFEILAEIGQELCQPLAVINCSIEMIRSGMLGDVNEMQTEMLDTAVESGQKLSSLIDKIITIAGMPKTSLVDKDIQSSLYQ